MMAIGRSVVCRIAKIWPAPVPVEWIFAGLVVLLGGLLADPRARGGIRPIVGVADGRGRHPSRFSTW